MTELPHAILIGGPPHAGKSVLLYNLTHALYEREVRHHAIRACPDGDGNWYQEGNPETVSTICKDNKRPFSPTFISRMSDNLHHRCLPFLVDMGGEPRETDLPLFRQCTHSILLLRADLPDSTEVWQQMVAQANLKPLARLFSQQKGDSSITAHAPVLEGHITGLERQSRVVRQDPVFIALLERIASFFQKEAMDMERGFLAQAPTGTALDLPTELQAFTTSSRYWQPDMLMPFLRSVPQNMPLSVHGKGPNWLYAALMAHAGEATFYQFDPKLPFGWIQPLSVCTGENHSDDIAIKQHMYQDTTVLSITFPVGRVEYVQPEPLAFPAVPPEHGLILDGPLPQWLLTALVRLYQQNGVAWIAPHYAQQNVHEPRKTAIVIYSRVNTHNIGDLVDLPV